MTTVAAILDPQKSNEGWRACQAVLNKEGLPSTDPLEAGKRRVPDPLGGSPENPAAGYGLAAMVNILASCLSGATLITDP
jgi:LDH2 family malate/lactate/ureidoglycolate dehydrogenase